MKAKDGREQFGTKRTDMLNPKQADEPMTNIHFLNGVPREDEHEVRLLHFENPRSREHMRTAVRNRYESLKKDRKPACPKKHTSRAGQGPCKAWTKGCRNQWHTKQQAQWQA